MSRLLTVAFDNDVSSIDVSFAWQHSGEEAHYAFFKDGVSVGDGGHMGITDGIDPVMTLAPTNGSDFDTVVFSAPGGGDDYLIHSIEFERTFDPVVETQEEILVGGDGNDTIFGQEGDDIIYGDNRDGDMITADLDISLAKLTAGSAENDGANTDEADGSESYSIEITVPAGATLSNYESVNGNVYTLTAAHLAGLTITVAAGTPSFDVDVTVHNNDNNGVDDVTNTRTVTLDDVAFTNPVGHDDDLAGGAGVDEVHGQQGDDTVTFTLGEGGSAGNLESLDGGKDTDTLRIDTSTVSADEAAELARLERFIIDNSDDCVAEGGTWVSDKPLSELLEVAEVKKADGTKFGKTEGGNVWLDKNRTSPYKFYQYWINSSDEDTANFIRIFTLKTKEEIEALEKEHAEAPHLRVLQKALGEDITVRVHSKEDLEAAINASEILFLKGDAAVEGLKSLSEQIFEDVFDGVPQAEIALAELENGLGIIDVLSAKTNFLKSGGEARRALKENSISINKAKVGDDKIVNATDLISGKYILLQRGKKNYFIVKAI